MSEIAIGLNMKENQSYNYDIEEIQYFVGKPSSRIPRFLNELVVVKVFIFPAHSTVKQFFFEPNNLVILSLILPAAMHSCFQIQSLNTLRDKSIEKLLKDLEDLPFDEYQIYPPKENYDVLVGMQHNINIYQ